MAAAWVDVEAFAEATKEEVVEELVGTAMRVQMEAVETKWRREAALEEAVAEEQFRGRR